MKREITVTQTKEQRSKRNRSVTHNNNTYDVAVYKKKEQRINFSTCNQCYNWKQTLIPTLVEKKNSLLNPYREYLTKPWYAMANLHVDHYQGLQVIFSKDHRTRFPTISK